MILNNFKRLQKLARQHYAYVAVGDSESYSEYFTIKTIDNQDKYISDKNSSRDFYIDGQTIRPFKIGDWLQNGIKLTTQDNTINRTNYIPRLYDGDLAICFGDGSTPATEDDYTLGGNFIPNYSDASSTVSQDVGSLSFVSRTVSIDTETGVRTIYHNYINNSPISVTIGEWGLFTNYNAEFSIMLTHDVLATPITIPQGGTLRVGITLNNN